jgi:hypothetical protein
MLTSAAGDGMKMRHSKKRQEKPTVKGLTETHRGTFERRAFESPLSTRNRW